MTDNNAIITDLIEWRIRRDVERHVEELLVILPELAGLAIRATTVVDRLQQTLALPQ